MPTERFDVNLTLKAQRQGEKAFAETDAGLKVVRDAVKRFSEAEANGLTVGAAYKHSISGFRDDALEAGLSLEAEAQAVRDVTRAIDRFRESEAAGLPFDEALTASTEEQTVAAEESAVAQDASSTSVLGGIPGWILMAAAIGAVVITLWPFIAAVLSATVAIIGFIVAGAGAVILFAGLAIGVGAVGVAMGFLASKLPGFQKTISPLVERFKEMAHILEARTGPMLRSMVRWLEALLPIVQRVGLYIEGWFGARLNGILRGISGVIKDLTPSFETFAKTMSREFDKSGPAVKTFFEIFAKATFAALPGLVDNLLRLTKWFNTESPKWKPIWDAIGRAVQWVASTWAKLNDWIVANWPATMTQVQGFIDSIKDGWEKWKPLLEKILPLIMQFVQIGMQAIIDHAGILIAILSLAVLGFFAVIAILAILVGAFVTAASAVGDFITNTKYAFTDWANSVIGLINTVIDGLNHIPGVVIGHVPYITTDRQAPKDTSHAAGEKDGTDTRSKSRGGYTKKPSVRHAPHHPGAVTRHSGGNVSADEVYVTGGPGAEEIFIPNKSGKVVPATASGGGGSAMSSKKVEKVLSDVKELLASIDDHLEVIRHSSPGVTPAAQVRRGG